MDFKRLTRAFRFASRGVMTAVKEEQNIKIFAFFVIINIVLGFILKIDRVEWAIITLTTFACLALEILNVALEDLLDLISPEFNGKIKVIKDLAAGSVLVSSVGAFVIALIIYLPHIF